MSTRTTVDELRVEAGSVKLRLKPPCSEAVEVSGRGTNLYEGLLRAICHGVMQLQEQRPKGHPKGRTEFAEAEGNRGADPVRGEVKEVLLLLLSGAGEEDPGAEIQMGIQWKCGQRQDEADTIRVAFGRNTPAESRLYQVAHAVVSKLSDYWVLS